MKYLRLLAVLAMFLLTACSVDQKQEQSAGSGTGEIDDSAAALRPDQPAAVEAGFRADSAQLVRRTGRPQLVEFFAYW